MLVGKSRGGTPFCRTLKTVFSKSRIFCKAFSLQLFHRNSCKIVVYCFRETRRGGLVRPASKSCRFSHRPLRVPKGWHRDFAACGQRSGLLAHTSAAFLKNCCTEKLFICLRLVSCNPYPQKSPPPIMPTFFVKYLTNIPESSIIRESVFSLDLEKHGCPHNL